MSIYLNGTIEHNHNNLQIRQLLNFHSLTEETCNAERVIEFLQKIKIHILHENSYYIGQSKV